jgi:hypothetical protein
MAAKAREENNNNNGAHGVTRPKKERSMIIETSKALGAAILFFPEGNALAAGGNCSSLAIPDPNDPGWLNFQRVEEWDFTRKDAKYEAVKDGTLGRLRLADEIETDGYSEYKFTTNVMMGFLLGVFFRAATPLNANSYQFNPDTGISPKGWLILDNQDAAGNLIFSANLWGRLKLDAWKGGGGKLVKPEFMFTQYLNNLAVAAIGTR